MIKLLSRVILLSLNWFVKQVNCDSSNDEKWKKINIGETNKIIIVIKENRDKVGFDFENINFVSYIIHKTNNINKSLLFCIS